MGVRLVILGTSKADYKKFPHPEKKKVVSMRNMRQFKKEITGLPPRANLKNRFTKEGSNSKRKQLEFRTLNPLFWCLDCHGSKTKKYIFLVSNW